MEQREDMPAFGDNIEDTSISLEFTESPARVQYCEDCDNFKIFIKERGNSKCPICGDDMKRIDDNSIGILMMQGLMHILFGYVTALSKHWRGYVSIFLKKDIKRFMTGLICAKKRDIKVKIIIPRSGGLRWIKKELKTMLSRNYEWNSITVEVRAAHFAVSYEFIRMVDGWKCSTKVGVE